MPPHPFTNFKIQKYYQSEPRFNSVYLKDSLNKIKDGDYIINLDEYSQIGTHWVALHVNNNYATYFHSFGVEHIPKEIKELVKNKNIKTFQNSSKRFSNVRIFLYWFYGFSA